MINSFSRFLVEEEKVAYFAFGRMNPPTIGHGKLMDKLASVAGKNPYFLYLSQSNDKKNNPLLTSHFTINKKHLFQSRCFLFYEHCVYSSNIVTIFN